MQCRIFITRGVDSLFTYGSWRWANPMQMLTRFCQIIHLACQKSTVAKTVHNRQALFIIKLAVLFFLLHTKA